MLDLMTLNQAIAQIIQCDKKVYWMTLGDVLGVVTTIIFFHVDQIIPIDGIYIKRWFHANW